MVPGTNVRPTDNQSHGAQTTTRDCKPSDALQWRRAIASFADYFAVKAALAYFSIQYKV